jgi:conjugative transfer signal peptidase TraF
MTRVKNFYPLLCSLFLISILAVIIAIIKYYGFYFTYSATMSVPRGLYLIVPAKKFERYEMVEFLPPPKILDFVRDLRWLPKSGLLIKYVFAVPNDYVCVRKNYIWINDKKVGKIYEFYSFGKKLPQTKICGRLAADKYLLMSTKKERSFDGRYFGAISVNNIVGRAIPIFIIDR